MTTLSSTLILDGIDQVEANELVRRALAGCPDAFAELSRRFRPRLVQLLQQRLGGCWADAEDVAQDTLARAFQQLARFDPRYRFSTWLFTIAFRLASDHVRRQRRHQRHVHLDAAREVIGSSGSEDRVEQFDNTGNLWSTAQKCLPPNQFTALWLRFGEDLTVAEIARVMQKSQVCVRVLLHRARMNLMNELAVKERCESIPLSERKIEWGARQ